MDDVLAQARDRAQDWSRVFQGLVQVLDRLEHCQESLLGRSLVFLIHRSLAHLSTTQRPQGVPPRAPAPVNEARELTNALDCLHDDGARLERSVRDELDVLLTLASSLVEGDGEGAFADATVTDRELAAEFHSLRQVSTGLASVRLFPRVFCDRWQALLEEAEGESDPLRRLGLEMSLMRVIRSLYALAIGYRDAEEPFDGMNVGREPWLAFTLGEATLGQCA